MAVSTRPGRQIVADGRAAGYHPPMAWFIRIRPLLLAAPLVFAAGVAAAQPDAGRGRLLYETHCIACHTTQVHWRVKRLAGDWTQLQALVWRWQVDAQLNWSAADVEAVALHLNETFYRLPLPRRRAQALADESIAAAGASPP